ncbi:ORF6N domain-containing protein [Rummeliibacillus sp. JY-2-4R]
MVINGLPVLTTKSLSERFGVDSKNLLRNFERNRSKFNEGKHFMIVSGDDLVKIKNELDEAKHACILYVWTEEGAFMLAKFLRNVNSWEDYYHNVFAYYEKNRP